MFVSNRYCPVEPQIADAVHRLSYRLIEKRGERMILEVSINELSSSLRFIVTQQHLAKTFGGWQLTSNQFFPGNSGRRLSSRRNALLASQMRDALNTKSPVTTYGLLGSKRPSSAQRFTVASLTSSNLATSLVVRLAAAFTFFPFTPEP